MPRFDYKCDTCGRVEERFFGTYKEKEAYDETIHPCKPNPAALRRPRGCQGKMRVQVSAPNFAIKGYSAANGYTEKN